jgi:hypothetical protein
LSGGGVLVEWLQAGWRHNEKQAITGTVRICAPEEIRTPNLLIRSQMLYPLSYGRMLFSYLAGGGERI